MRLRLRSAPDFDFPSSVCSHGWFVLAPNQWVPTRGVLNTCLFLATGRAVRVAIGQASEGVGIDTATRLTPEEAHHVRSAVSRMLRLNEDLSAFHKCCRRFDSHHLAARRRFGRLLRGASLFEDVVKVICTCNVTWRQTVSMVSNLVANWGLPADHAGMRAFPGPERLAQPGASELRRIGRLGYRANFVSRLARDVDAGRLDLQGLETFQGPTPELHRMLKLVHGIGDYGAASLCMLLGRYDCLAIDTEMIRFLKEKHPRRRFTPASARRYYQAWRPYQFLAYWWELWSEYQVRHGPAQTWKPERTGSAITSQSGSG